MHELTTKRLTRSADHRIIAGVCGGIADRFGWDPTLVRVLFVLVSVLSAAVPGALLYLLAWMIIPDERNVTARGEVLASPTLPATHV